jgi:hypothetical protein
MRSKLALPVATLLVATLLICLCGLSNLASAQGGELPCRFHGTVTVDGLGVSDGTAITAIIGGDTHDTATPVPEYGPSTYAIKITVPEGKKYAEGTTVTFKVGNYFAEETGSWNGGGNLELDLTAYSVPRPTPTPTPAPTLPPTPQPTPTPTPTATPTPTPTPTPAPAASGGNAYIYALISVASVILIGIGARVGYHRLKRRRADKPY